MGILKFFKLAFFEKNCPGVVQIGAADESDSWEKLNIIQAYLNTIAYEFQT